MKVRTTLLGATLLVMATGQCFGAELQRLTLGEAIARGLKLNNQVRAAGFQAEAARAGATAASLHYLPSVTVEEAWSRSNVPVNTFMMKLNQGRFTDSDFKTSSLNNPSPVSDFRSQVTVEQPLLAPAAWAGQRVAGRGAERQEALTQQAREQIAFQVFQLYLEVKRAKAYLKAADQAVEDARESRRQAVVRTRAGMGLKSDELRADTQLAAMEQQAITAADNLTLARMQLALVTGGESGSEVDAGGAVVFNLPAQKPDQLLQLALQQRQDLLAAERGKEQADAALLQVRAGFLPTMGAFGSWQMNDHTTPFSREHDAWMAGVSLRWNLFDGFRTWNGSGQARAARNAAAEMVEATRKEVDYQVREALLRSREADKRLQVARAAVASAEEATRILSKRFDNALATMLELLDAQSALNQARANLVESESAQLLAVGKVYYRAGLFLKEVQQ